MPELPSYLTFDTPKLKPIAAQAQPMAKLSRLNTAKGVEFAQCRHPNCNRKQNPETSPLCVRHHKDAQRKLADKKRNDTIFERIKKGESNDRTNKDLLMALGLLAYEPELKEKTGFVSAWNLYHQMAREDIDEAKKTWKANLDAKKKKDAKKKATKAKKVTVGDVIDVEAMLAETTAKAKTEAEGA